MKTPNFYIPANSLFFYNYTYILLADSMANIHPRVEACEGRIATLEDNMDGRFREHESAISSLMGEQEEFPVDKSIICIGLKETPREDMYTRSCPGSSRVWTWSCECPGRQSKTTAVT